MFADSMRTLFKEGATEGEHHIEGESAWCDAIALFAMIAATKWQDEHRAMLLEVAMWPWSDEARDHESDWNEWADDPDDKDGRALRAMIVELGGECPPYPEEDTGGEVAGD